MSSFLRSASTGQGNLGIVVDCCADCVHFHNDAATIERAFPGLSAMGSAGADVRSCDGLCALHGVYLAFSDRCPQFERAIRTQH